MATATDYRVDVELHAGLTRGKSWRYQPPLRLAVGIGGSAGGMVHMLKSVDNRMLLSMVEQALEPIYFSIKKKLKKNEILNKQNIF